MKSAADKAIYKSWWYSAGEKAKEEEKMVKKLILVT